MSAVLVLRLAGPLQSWGVDSRFTRRSTEAFPTKSALVGLLGAAQGRRRSDPIEDLAELSVAVRVDQPGQLLHDFHTAHRGDTSMPLSHRFYRADAAFGAFIEGPDDMIDALADLGIIPPQVEKTSQQTLQDMPISFDSENRKYTLRTVEETYIDLENPQYVETKPQAHPGLVHDPMEVL